MEKEESWSSVSYGLMLGACWVCPRLLEGGAHVECGRSARGMRAVAAASGVSAPTSVETSGNAERGGV